MTNKLLLIAIILSFIGIILSCLATDVEFPVGVVTVDTELVEIEFVPTHSLYQKRCLVDGELVYCADTGSLATVTIDTQDIEVDFIADAQ